MVMISERPPEVADRAVPGHWEGVSLMGTKTSAIATLVERQTRYVQLVALPNGFKAEPVRQALVASIQTLPEQLCRSLTWDQGHEMAQHKQLIDRHRRADLLLRSPKPMAARIKREHQRAAAPVLPQRKDRSKTSPKPS